MRKNIIYCVLTAHIFVLVNSTGVSSKLDFGDDDEGKKIVITSGDLKLDKTDDNSATTVVCVNGGCNKTEVKNDEFLTDVVVHVKTSQNVAKTNKTIGETPDIPIVVGYGGVTQKPFSSDSLISSNPSTVTNLDQNAFYPSSFNSYNHHRQRIQPHPSFQRKFSPDYNNQVSYENMFIPILPTFHTQYFAEQPPQQYVWYPKGGASYNPVEFKKFERPVAWNQVQHNKATQSGGSAHVTTPGYTTCTCQNPGLNWYPTTPTWNIHNQRSDGIDDKLAELN